MAPNFCVCGCVRPTEQGSVASGNATYGQESLRPSIPLNHRLLLDVVLRMVVLQPEVCSDGATTDARLCDSVLFSASLVCKHSY